MGSYVQSAHEKMLANLTSLIWGSENTPTTTSSSPAKTTTIEENGNEEPLYDSIEASKIRASTPTDDEESDWVLVDRAVSPSSLPTPDEHEESPMRDELNSEVGDGQQVDLPTVGRTAGVAQRTPSLIQALDVLRPAQKAQRRREERRLKHKHLDKSNKAREVASAGNKRSRRREMLTPAKFSRAVNNRKC
ncbi:hypothetical protein SK128_005593 [Halocaridina rubra]|uniref:Uncharacterized protein n=1 Tax=Halocaridina rubra TaxID=373956 RepID=A0AAN8X2T4_HALRR